MPAEPDLRGKALALHLVGIGGSGMSGLAEILKGLGHRVSGSDSRLGGHAAANVPPAAAAVVISAAVPASNPEVVEAKRRGLPLFKYAEAVGKLMKGTRGVAVAGTHGKTTTTSALAFVLRDAGWDPTFLIGGAVPQLGGSAGFGKGGAFVVEACEYDRSFHNYRPEVAVITNIDADHLDYYKDLEEINQAFRHFAEGSGTVVGCGDDPRAAAMADAAYGFSEGCGWRLSGLETDEKGCRYRLSGEGKRLEVSTLLAGRHNALNTAAAAVACLKLGVTPEAVVKGLAAFRGAGRRLERLGEVRGVEVFDDYGHHPKEIACALAALQQRCPGKPIRVIFQPHQYHRTRVFLREFAEVLARDASETIVPGIYAARGAEPEVGAGDLVKAIREAGGKAEEAAGLEAAGRMGAERAKAGEVLLTLGAGDIGELGPKLLDLLR